MGVGRGGAGAWRGCGGAEVVWVERREWVGAGMTPSLFATAARRSRMAGAGRVAALGCDACGGCDGAGVGGWGAVAVAWGGAESPFVIDAVSLE